MRTALVLVGLILLSAMMLPSSLRAQERAGTAFTWDGNPVSNDRDAPLVTDRPDFTEATGAVGVGVVQVELGYTGTVQGDVTAHSLGEPLVRVGVFADWIELRAAAFPTATTIERNGRTESDTGLPDIYVGIKAILAPQAGLLPRLGVIVQATLPTGSDGYTSDRILPGINVLYGWDLEGALSLAGSTQINSARDGSDDTYGKWAQSVAVSRPLDERIGVFAEWFAIVQQDSGDTGTLHYANAGFSFSISPDTQADVRVGAGLNEEADDFFVGIGLAKRIR